MDRATLQTVINYAIILLGIVMSISILLQVRGSGMGSLFGSIGGDFYRSRRGIEKFTFNVTIITAILFTASCIASVILNKA